jgi:hypothetical protein
MTPRTEPKIVAQAVAARKKKIGIELPANAKNRLLPNILLKLLLNIVSP